MMSGISHNSDPSEPTIDLDDLINQLTPDIQQQSVGMEGTRTQLQSYNYNSLSKLNIGAVNLDGNFYRDVANKVSQPLQHQQFHQQQLLRKDQQPYIRPSLIQSNIPHGHQKQHHQMPFTQFQPSPLLKLQHQMQLQSGSQSQPPGLQTTMFDKQPQQQHHQPLNQLNHFASSYPQPLGTQNHEFGSQRDMLRRHQMSASLLRPHSVTVDGCQKTMEQLQPMVLNSSSGVANQVQNASVSDWYNEAYQQIQLMKEMYLPQLLIVYKKAQESCLQQSDGQLATKSQKTRAALENMIKFLQIARPKIVHIPREKLLNHMKMVKYQLSKIKNSVSLQSKTPQLQLNRNTGSQFNPLGQSSAFAQIGTPPNLQANSTSSHQNGSLVGGGISNHPSLLPHGSAGQQYALSLLHQTNEMATIKQSTWMPRGRSVKNASQSTWSPPPEPNSSPRIFVDASDPKMITSFMTSPQSVPSHHQMMHHPEKTKKSVPFGSSSLSTSPLISPSPSIPSTPPIDPAGPKKNPSGISSLSIVGPEENPKTAGQNIEGSQQSHATEQPIQRLLNAVKSISSAALAASSKDIESVVSMIDEVPPEGTIFDIQFENSANSEGERRKRTRATPLDDSSRLSCLQFDRESTATSNILRPKTEASINNLLEEIKYINRKLVETTLEVDSNSADNISRAGAVHGTVVRCSYSGIGFAELFRLHLNSQRMLPNLFVRLLVPADYPNSSPKVFDALSDGSSENPEDLTKNVKVAFGLSLRKLPQPVSLREMARTWDMCARAVFTEFAKGMGGKSFSSRNGDWEQLLDVNI